MNERNPDWTGLSLLALFVVGGVFGALASTLRKGSPVAAAVAPVEHDWDVESFVFTTAQKRHDEIKRTRSSRKFQETMVIVRDQIEKEFMKGRYGDCVITADGICDKSYPFLPEVVCDELRRRGFKAQHGVSPVLNKEVINVELPHRPWRHVK